MSITIRAGLAAALLTLAGCASQPSPIATEPAGNVPIAEVRANPDAYVGKQVRWGGAIASVENKANQTWVEIVGRELKDNGRPLLKKESRGRFLARFQGFLDPAVYAPGRLITIIGTIEGKTTRNIGDFPYLYPVVAVTDSQLWELKRRPVFYHRPPPWYYDPWYPYPWLP